MRLVLRKIHGFSFQGLVTDTYPGLGGNHFACLGALMLDEIDKLYVTAARARESSDVICFGVIQQAFPGTWINSIGFDLNRIFSELPVVALIMTLTEMGSLLIDYWHFPTTSSWQERSW